MAERRVAVTVDADVAPYVRALLKATGETKAFSKELESSDARLTNLVSTGAALAPALVPLGTIAVPAVAGLATELGFAAAAAGTVALAFAGIGTALDAVNKYHLDPTKANLEKMRQELHSIGPAGAEFVHFLRDLEPDLHKLQDLARAGIFPGLESALVSLSSRLPAVETVVSSIADTLGKLAGEAGQSLAGPQWDEFFLWVQQTAVPTLQDMGHAFGDVVLGLTNVVVALDPLSRDFSNGLVRMADAFEKWSEGLSGSQGFQEFIGYVRTEAPQVGHLLATIADALVHLVEAAAPMGAVTLKALQGLATILGDIAASPAGPTLVAVATSVSLLNKAVGSYSALKASSLVGNIKEMGKARMAAGALSALAFSLTAVAQSSGHASDGMTILGDAASGALAGFAIGNGPGAVIGGVAGALTGLATATSDSTDAFQTGQSVVQDYIGTLNQLSGAVTNLTKRTVYQNLQKTGELRVFRLYGIPDRETINAMVGNVDAYVRIKKRLDDAVQAGTLNRQAESDILNSIRARRREIAREGDAVATETAAVESWNKALQGLPHGVKVALRNENYDPTMEQIRKLQHEYDLTPKQVRTILTAIDRASDTIRRVQYGLGQIHDKTVTVSVIESRDFKVSHLPGMHAEGGLMRGPGGPTDDLIPAYLSNGEYVMRAAAVDHYGPALFDALNAMRFAQGGYALAAGGTVPTFTRKAA